MTAGLLTLVCAVAAAELAAALDPLSSGPGDDESVASEADPSALATPSD